MTTQMTVPRLSHDLRDPAYRAALAAASEPAEYEASLDPTDPDNFWVDDATGERVCAWCAHRGNAHAPECRNPRVAR